MIKKRDIILALMMILLGIVGYGVIRLGQKKGSQVVIYVAQKEIGRYDLDTDTTKEIHRKRNEYAGDREWHGVCNRCRLSGSGMYSYGEDIEDRREYCLPAA